MKKKLLAPIMAVIALCLVALTACGGPSVEDLIREDLTTQFEEIKAGSDELVEDIEANAGAEFDQLGVDPAAFTDSYLDGFDYEIGDITVEDGTATANVTVTCKSMGDILTNFQTQFTEELNSIDLTTLESEDDLYKMAGQVMIDVTAAAEAREVECDFTYSQDDEGTWSADASAEDEMMNAMMS